jgi:hypothetical protein
MGETFFQAAGGQIEGKESVFLVTILQFWTQFTGQNVPWNWSSVNP